jgi:hypothetical protein
MYVNFPVLCRQIPENSFIVLKCKRHLNATKVIRSFHLSTHKPRIIKITKEGKLPSLAFREVFLVEVILI